MKKFAQQIRLPRKWWNPFTWFYKKKVYGVSLDGWECKDGFREPVKIFNEANVFEFKSKLNVENPEAGKYIGHLPSANGIILDCTKQYYFVFDIKK